MNGVSTCGKCPACGLCTAMGGSPACWMSRVAPPAHPSGVAFRPQPAFLPAFGLLDASQSSACPSPTAFFQLSIISFS